MRHLLPPFVFIPLAIHLLLQWLPAQMAETTTSQAFLEEAQRTSDPGQKQRLLREAIREDSTNVEARAKLGESYYLDSGNIEASLKEFQMVTNLADSTDVNFADVNYYLSDIDRLFKPLQILIIDKRVNALGYIEGIDLQFRYPRFLTEEQKRRLEYLKNEQTRRPNEFQIDATDTSGRPYFELRYFPVNPSPEAREYNSYAIVVNGKKRYRFDFTESQHDPVKIQWYDDWKLVERVPPNLVKLEYPATYTFAPADTVRHFTLLDSIRDKKGIYIPAGENTEIVLKRSRREGTERFYNHLVKFLVFAATVGGLLGTR